MEAAEAALAEARGLVTIPNAGGRYSTRILPDPDAVLRVKEVLARAIEGLRAIEGMRGTEGMESGHPEGRL